MSARLITQRAFSYYCNFSVKYIKSYKKPVLANLKPFHSHNPVAQSQSFHLYNPSYFIYTIQVLICIIQVFLFVQSMLFILSLIIYEATLYHAISLRRSQASIIERNKRNGR